MESAAKPARASGRRKGRPSPRERLLASATHLFTTEGIRVIGIDRILREADVAKASLYSLFGSKDALVVAYVEQLDAQWRAAWSARAAELKTPDQKVLAFFDQCIEEEPAKNFRGSHFLNAATEYPRPETDLEHKIVATAQAHRRWCEETITQLLTELNGYPSASVARQVLVFLEGGLAGATMAQNLEPLKTARELADQLISAPPADYSI
ncbi:TetR/AcrR family transcriptional regulator [Corynebacterium epidermidicanis]|uniref:Transcriptional regulator, TetR family n=1 Tax=Corynebacterium epidermidicanis TaxID=1050174 RepID=A0A0G3GSR2_9CORY|nr:TetR/AcrR family transcriptional regulator [Corynebacterium epidermidicanis]AKK04196.1 transcriptional regulator, TetR family [Corynebacterium epidermidicanis]